MPTESLRYWLFPKILFQTAYLQDDADPPGRYHVVMKLRAFIYNRRIILVLFSIYFITRLYKLTLLPIFTDESIYLYWAKFIETFHSHWFLPITDGKPPLFVWVISAVLAVLPGDLYLLAGRMVTVCFGGLTLWGIYTLARYLFPGDEAENVPVYASLLYIVTPFAFFYDRMVLFDTPLTAALIWATYFTLKAAQRPTFASSLLWGLTLGTAFYLKSTALVFWLLLPFVAYFWAEHTKSLKTFGWKKLVAAVLLALLLSEGINQTLRISSAYPSFLAKNNQFQVDPWTLWPNPFAYAVVSLPAILSWTIQWMTWPVFFLGVLGTLFLVRTMTKVGVIFLLLWFVPVIGFSIVGQQLFPRYTLFIAPYLMISGAYLFNRLVRDTRPLYQAGSVLFIVLSVLVISPVLYALTTNPVYASMPQPDRDQYIADHPSGYGLSEVFRIIDAARQSSGEVTVITQGTFGLYPYAFDLRYWDDTNVHILPVWPINSMGDLPKVLPPDQPVYIVFKEVRTLPPDFPATIVATIPKPSPDKPPIIVAEF